VTVWTAIYELVHVKVDDHDCEGNFATFKKLTTKDVYVEKLLAQANMPLFASHKPGT